MTATALIPAQRNVSAAERWELVNRAQTGDPTAWDEMYRLYQPAVYAFKVKLDELNAISDGFERGKYVVELLQSVALTINSLPRGYAQMGRTR